MISIRKHFTPKQRKRIKRRAIFLSLAAVFALAVTIFVCLVPFRRLLPAYPIEGIESGFRVHFVDVGQGDATILEFGAGDLLVVDAGDGSFVHNNRLARYIKGLSPEHISLLITHADSDHYGGALSLLEVFSIEKVYLPVLQSKDERYQTLLKKAKEGETFEMTRFQTIEKEGAYLVCLSPDRGEGDSNASSCVLYCNLGGVRGLFMGDVPASKERQILEEYAASEHFFDVGNCAVDLKEIDFLKVSHHGSKDSSSAEFLSLIKPKASIISCGAGNYFGHPAGETVMRLKEASKEGKIYRTDELGSISLTIENNTFRIQTNMEKR